MHKELTNFRALNGVTPSGHYLLTCIHCEQQFYSADKDADYCSRRACQKAKQEIAGDNSIDYKFSDND